MLEYSDCASICWEVMGRRTKEPDERAMARLTFRILVEHLSALSRSTFYQGSTSTTPEFPEETSVAQKFLFSDSRHWIPTANTFVMPLTAIYTVPHVDSFTTLVDHQSQTPETFYNAKPVLHFHGVGIRALAASSQMSKLSIFSSASGAQPERTEDEDEKPEVVTVDAFVASEYGHDSHILRRNY